MKNQRGFTIIELIVVIAIIAVLAAIVLVNVTSYINKGKDAAIEGNLAGILTNAADYFNTNSSYDKASTSGGGDYGICQAAVVKAARAAAEIAANGGTATCTVSADWTAFCACSPMIVTTGTGGIVANTYFCVDSTGTKTAIVNSTGCSAVCPTSGVCL